MKPKQIVEMKNGVKTLVTKNSLLRLGVYSTAIACLGLTSSPLFVFANAINPIILPTAITLTTAIFAGASAYAYTRPKGALLSW